MDASVESLKHYCHIHPEKKVKFVCLDPTCSAETTNACILCVKNKHKSCKDEFLLDKRELASKIELQVSNFDFSKMTNDVGEILDKQIYEFNKKLLSKKNEFVSGLEIDASPSNLTPEALKNSKKNLMINYDKERKKIVIKSKFDSNDENLPDSLLNFDKKVEKLFEKVLSDFSKLRFNITGGLNASDWLGHANILITDESSSLKISRKPEDTTFNYFCAICTQPLESSCVYKLTINSIYESDRFLDFGIVDKNKFNSIQSDGFINTFGSGGISFCGYSSTGGLSGAQLTSGHTDISGFKEGDYVYLEYTLGSEIKVYNESLSNNLSYSGLSPNTEYYLFVVVYHPQASATLEKLK